MDNSYHAGRSSLPNVMLQSQNAVATQQRALAVQLERTQILTKFRELACQMADKTNDADDSEAGLVWTAAASSIRRVCDELSIGG